MSDVFAHQFVKPGAELREDVDAVPFLHFSAVTHEFGEVAVAQLLDDVVIISGFFELQEADDVLGTDIP